MAEDAGSRGLVANGGIVVDIPSVMRGHREARIEGILVAGGAEVVQARGAEWVQGGKTDGSALGEHRFEMGWQGAQDEVFTDGENVSGGCVGIVALDAQQLKIPFLFYKGGMAGKIAMG